MSTLHATGPFVPPDPATTRPDLRGTRGMVASTHWTASTIAHTLLEQGGNAFDAAAAGGFALHLVEPHLNGPGGDMTAVFATADEPGTPRVLMGQGAAPAGATIDHLRAEGLDRVPGSGALAAAIPGGGRCLAPAAGRARIRGHRRRPLTGDRPRRERPPRARAGLPADRGGRRAVHRTLAALCGTVDA